MDTSDCSSSSGDDFEYEARDYQVELFEQALEENVIVWLETGAGKTFIATLLIRELAGQTMDKYGSGKNGKRTIVLVNSVALAKQQATYIQKHTCLKVKPFVGEMNVDVWDRSKWLEELNSCQVVVVTAQIVADMLSHQYLSFEHVNLLMFDECHHGANNHPYKVIMNHYASWKNQMKAACPLSSRNGPRIMGLSACLFKGKVKSSLQMHNKLSNLEKTFFAKIVTTSFDTSAYAAKPEESLLKADDMRDKRFLELPSLKELEKCVKTIVSDGNIGDLTGLVSQFGIEDCFASNRNNRGGTLKSLIGDLRHCFETMGVTALQIYLEKLLRDISETNKKNPLFNKSSVETQFLKLVTIIVDVQTDTQRFHLNSVRNFCSAKLWTLWQVLLKVSDQFKKEKREFCGIIFVQRRYSTVVLHQIVSNWAGEGGSPLSHLKPVFATGQTSTGAGCKSASTNGKEQILALRKFRTGQANLLIATSVVEEGIDIPHCNFVCKFDIPQDFRSYTQSKGRARAKNSYYVVITTPEEHVDFEEKLITIFRPIEAFLLTKCFDRSLPTEEESFEYFKGLQNSTLAPFSPFDYPSAPVVTAQTALNLVNRYCNTLPSDRFTSMKARVKIEELGGSNFVATMRLPTSSVITAPVSGDAQNSKQEAKISAALAVCKLLYEKGELDSKLLPKRKKVLSDSTCGSRFLERKLSTGASEKVIVYEKKYPRQFTLPVEEAHLFYMYEINQVVLDSDWICDFVPGFAWARDYRMGFLSPAKLPKIPNFLIYSLFGTENVSLDFVKEVLLSDEEKLAAIDLNRWIYEEVLLVPGVLSRPNASPFSIITVIFDKNDCLLTSHEIKKQTKSLPWTDSVVVQFPNTERLNFVESCEGEIAKLRVIGKRILYLTKERSKMSDYRLPRNVSALQKMEYPAAILYKAMCLPAILHRVCSFVYTETFLQDAALCLSDERMSRSLGARDNLLKSPGATFVPNYYDLEKPDSVLQMFKEEYVMLDRYEDKPRLPLPTMALKCFVLKSAHSGDDINLERFEVLGDAFLKFAVSRALFCENPLDDEGKLTEEKHSLVSNANLSRCAERLELGSHILAQNSVPRENWLPPLFISKTLHNQTVPSGDSNSSRTSSPSSSACDPIMQHKFKRKCLADVIESLIGCFVCYSSLELAFQFTHKFLDISVLPSNSEGSFKIQSPRCTDERTSLLMDEEVKLLVGLDKIEKGLKYTFNEKLWLVQALTHATYFRNSITSNYQRLEFLGDAILDFLITRHIHNTYKNMDPGKLTDLRSALVNNVLFASLSVQLGLHRALKHMSSKLDYEIDKFVKFVTSTSDDGIETVNLVTFCDLFYSSSSDGSSSSLPSTSNGASTSTGSSYLSNYQDEWLEDPKPLGDIFEATVGAIYLDSGFDLECVWNVVFPLMEDVIKRYAKRIPLMPVRELFEMFPNEVIFEEVTAEGETIVLQTGAASASPKRGDDEYSTGEEIVQTSKTVKVTVKGKVFEARSSNLKNAKRKVAKMALKYFQSQDVI